MIAGSDGKSMLEGVKVLDLTSVVFGFWRGSDQGRDAWQRRFLPLVWPRGKYQGHERGFHDNQPRQALNCPQS